MRSFLGGGSKSFTSMDHQVSEVKVNGGLTTEEFEDACKHLVL